jgi:hypothetical protein
VDTGSGQKVYFQPPEDLAIVHPCIVYARDAANTRFAGNFPYLYKQRYAVTIIDPDPDSVIIDKVAALPLSVFNRHFAANGLNHDVFVVYF